VADDVQLDVRVLFVVLRGDLLEHAELAGAPTDPDAELCRRRPMCARGDPGCGEDPREQGRDDGHAFHRNLLWCSLDTFTTRAYGSCFWVTTVFFKKPFLKKIKPRPPPPLLKRINEESVLDTIRSGAPISRAEIARRAGISKPTVSLALRSLLEAG